MAIALMQMYNILVITARANKYLHEDLNRLFDQEGGGLTIPWYILIDKNGDIATKLAKRPLQIEELEKEINEL